MLSFILVLLLGGVMPAGNLLASDKEQNPHYIIPFLCYIFDKFIIHYFQTYIYPPSFLPTRKGMD